MIVMRIAMTPSLKASSRPLLMRRALLACCGARFVPRCILLRELGNCTRVSRRGACDTGFCAALTMPARRTLKEIVHASLLARDRRDAHAGVLTSAAARRARHGGTGTAR